MATFTVEALVWMVITPVGAFFAVVLADAVKSMRDDWRKNSHQHHGSWCPSCRTRHR